MPALPTTVNSTATSFEPFPDVQQTNDFDDVFARCAMLAGTKRLKMYGKQLSGNRGTQREDRIFSG